MDIILKTIGITMITVILCLFFGKQNKDISILLAMAACCIVFCAAGYYLESVLSFVNQLKVIGNLNGSFLEILLKAVGIGLICEVSALICADAGNSALGKTIHIVAAGAILWISLPLLSSLLELMDKILSET